nr:3-dehydroquinate synthase [Fimbriimonadaceae bacterium]
TRRDSTLFALGGGVIGDLAGFAAASYMRGIKLIMVPTSLLAMVDSSVGGKVGIDLPEGKNLVGAFYPPKEVRVAPTALATLPERHWFNGMAEVWKYGFIMDPLLLQSLRKGGLSKQSEEISWLIMRCIENKAKVVQEDEFETTGKRATLNFGHTIGHAIEKVLGYKDLLHGEAISIGMVEEAKLGERLGMTPKGLSHQVAQDLSSSALPIRLPDGLDAEEIVKAMRLDKKTDHQGLTFCMVTGEGTCTIVKGLTEETVLQSLRHS